ncbi:MAG: PSD1 domain-containing protein [Planctomycetaceae bacterium]|nr:PSD1 domain-containing protein [Planctomycetales bacterium]MCB9925234.1 PSD1 domain-containing protein [Planctomycetaceae bacterium]
MNRVELHFPLSTPEPMVQRVATLVNAVVVGMICFTTHSIAGDDAERFFESEIRPILSEHCIACHGATEQNGGLRLDSKQGLLRGGDSGPAVLSKSANSLILKAVRRTGDLAMPPDESLTEVQVAAIGKWVELGLPWPDSVAQLRSGAAQNAKDHWAFLPVQDPPIPATLSTPAVGNPIDAFVLKRLEEAGLRPSPEADRRTLIRRLSYSLTGLPPSAAEVEAFVTTESTDAYSSLVERYLASQQYGEHWARHWLDVARYSDTKGYVYAREERFWVHAWRYRDWVVNALNEDMPYDRFLLMQLAADQVADRRAEDLAAMGFLTIGRRFLGVNRDIIDDRIDVVTRGTLGLTVSCARCHDHKYDPIPTADYYSLYGVFNSCSEELVRLDLTTRDDNFEAELTKRRNALRDKLKSSRDESSQRARHRVLDYLHAQTELHRYPPNGFDQIFAKSDLLPAFVRRWEAYLRNAKREQNPVFVPWHMFAGLTPEEFGAESSAVCAAIRSATPEQINARVAGAFATPPSSFTEVIDRYGKILAEVDAEWTQQLAIAETDHFSDPANEQLRQVLYGPSSPCEVPDEGIVHTETFFDSGTCTALWKLQGEVDRWLIAPQKPPACALILKDRPAPSEPRVFRRGNILTQGSDVPRQFLAVLSQDERKPFQVGSGRLELAREIIDESNPLTARVIINRVWAQHFGVGLVSTPSDFGLRAERPSHPDLLDWLTSRFVSEGWSLKKLHRLIVTSAVFRQSSRGPTNEEDLARALKIDADNRLLWRMNSRRLTFEQFRDSMLADTRELILQVGGKPVDQFKDTSNGRRTLYGLVDRQFFPAILRVFDFANPDLHVPKRTQTTVPQQALFFMNHPLVLERAKRLAAVCGTDVPPQRAIEEMFLHVLQRRPTQAELKDALQVVSNAARETPEIRVTAAEWTYGFGKLNEATQQVEKFEKLPHFTGNSWQGGPAWPDPKLGWVQLSAIGGHPGNTREVACVRRWTAPRDMQVTLTSELRHEVAAGDGVRAFLVSSRSGQLGAAKVHQSTAHLNVEVISVSKGETIDFIVDIDSVLNSDQFLWKATITEAGEADVPTVWDSVADFPTNAVDRLEPLEQLAQVLFCSNEFLFVD